MFWRETLFVFVIVWIVEVIPIFRLIFIEHETKILSCFFFSIYFGDFVQFKFQRFARKIAKLNGSIFIFLFNHIDCDTLNFEFFNTILTYPIIIEYLRCLLRKNFYLCVHYHNIYYIPISYLIAYCAHIYSWYVYIIYA